ncbi:MAG: 16S rRNA (guanine(527)-N(7))-methyltransferase RsmG [Burkholderiaceae bacterium]
MGAGPGGSEWRERLRAGAQTIGVTDLTTEQVDRLAHYAGLLMAWARVFNLTGLRDADGVLSHHVLDCLAIVPAIDRWAAGRPLRILDVGSGAGLPGVVLAVVRPGWRICTVDAVAKKVAFVRQAAGELGLGNAIAVHGRVEDVPPGDGGFDLVVSRAFADLADFVSKTARHLAVGGVWLAMKGQRPQPEIDALPADCEVFHVEQLAVPGLDAARCLVWIRPH